MPLYIRFLKPPRCVSAGSEAKTSRPVTLSALITITSDLGESFYPHPAILRADLLQNPQPSSTDATQPSRVRTPRVVYTSRVPWTGSARNSKVEMQFTVPHALQDSEFTLRVSSEQPKPVDNLLEYIPGFGVGILSAYSAPFKLSGIAAKGLVERRLHLGQGRCLSIWEETGESIARHIWDGGVALTAYMAQHGMNSETKGPLSLFHEKLQQNKLLNVLELGSGCGIVGLAFAALHGNCHLTMTDLESAEEIVCRNLDSSQALLKGTATFQVYDWDEPLPPAYIHSPDIILVADCTYNPDSAESLVKTIERCTNRSEGTVVVLTHKKRHDSETVFFDLMRRSFESVDLWSFTPIHESDSAPETVDFYTFRLTA